MPLQQRPQFRATVLGHKLCPESVANGNQKLILSCI